MSSFAKKHNARLTVMENGEHWFHTEEQMKFLFKSSDRKIHFRQDA